MQVAERLQVSSDSITRLTRYARFFFLPGVSARRRGRGRRVFSRNNRREMVQQKVAGELGICLVPTRPHPIIRRVGAPYRNAPALRYIQPQLCPTGRLNPVSEDTSVFLPRLFLRPRKFSSADPDPMHRIPDVSRLPLSSALTSANSVPAVTAAVQRPQLQLLFLFLHWLLPVPVREPDRPNGAYRDQQRDWGGEGEEDEDGHWLPRTAKGLEEVVAGRCRDAADERDEHQSGDSELGKPGAGGLFFFFGHMAVLTRGMRAWQAYVARRGCKLAALRTGMGVPAVWMAGAARVGETPAPVRALAGAFTVNPLAGRGGASGSGRGSLFCRFIQFCRF